MKKVVTHLFTVIAAVTVCLVFLSFSDKEKEIKFVSMSVVLEKSSKKEKLMLELDEFEKKSNDHLTALNLELKQKEAVGVSANELVSLKNKLKEEQRSLSQAYAAESEKYQALVWVEINKKMEEFGKSKGYKFILGATGDGAIMYADDAEDVTGEFIEYLNK